LGDNIRSAGNFVDANVANMNTVRSEGLANVIRNALCYIKLFEPLCLGIDIVLGHTPIVKRQTWGGIKIPLIGELGFEAGLTIANLVWARLGMFDMGFGERARTVPAHLRCALVPHRRKPPPAELRPCRLPSPSMMASYAHRH